MHGFREGETETFPIERRDAEIWYAIIVMGSDFPRYQFASSISGKNDFVNTIIRLKKEGQKYLIFGIWHGQYRTDIFVLEEDKILKMMRRL